MGYYAKPEKQAQRVISWGLALGSGRRNNKSPALIHSISTANCLPQRSHHILQMDSKINSSGISYRSMSKLAPVFLRNGRGRLARKPWTVIGRLFNTCWVEQPERKFCCRGSSLLTRVGDTSQNSLVRIPGIRLNSFARICLDDQRLRHVSLMLQVCEDMSSIPSNVVQSTHQAHTGNGRKNGFSGDLASSIR